MINKKRLLAGICLVSLLIGCSKLPEPGSGRADGTEGSTTDVETQAAQAASQTQSPQESAQAAPSEPLRIIDDKYRTTYEIFVYSFADSDGDGIGDLQGVIQNLDYVNDGDDTTFDDLGCNGIWLMPISPSPTYHKYDITDYKAIDPEYGTMEDFDELIGQCHDRGIHVFIDLVLNHTSNEHPWFKEAYEYLKTHEAAEIMDEEGFTADALEQCPYLEYYNYSPQQLDGYERLNGTNWYYEARFWSEMPDLNLDSEKVRSEISDITSFWTEHGVDGFRLDAVTSYYTNDNNKITEFLTWLNDTIKSQNPDSYIVGEAWTNESVYAQYYQSGCDSFFDFNYANGEGMIAKLARGKMDASKFAESLKATEELLESNNPDYVDAPFYTNHDMARSAGYFTGKGADSSVKMAGGLNLLMGGNAFIYYGEELGMRGSGKDENKRAPMYWVNDAGSGEEYDRLKGIMCKGPKDMDDVAMYNPPYFLQKDDEYSILSYFRNAVRMRNTYPVIARGKTEPVNEIESERLGAFVRSVPSGTADSETFGPDSVLVVFNNSDEDITVDLSLSAAAAEYVNLSYQLNAESKESSLNGFNLTVAPHGIVILTR